MHWFQISDYRWSCTAPRTSMKPRCLRNEHGCHDHACLWPRVMAKSHGKKAIKGVCGPTTPYAGQKQWRGNQCLLYNTDLAVLNRWNSSVAEVMHRRCPMKNTTKLQYTENACFYCCKPNVQGTLHVTAL